MNTRTTLVSANTMIAAGARRDLRYSNQAPSKQSAQSQIHRHSNFREVTRVRVLYGCCSAIRRWGAGGAGMVDVRLP